MYEPPPDDRARLQEALQRVQHEKGEAEGMLQILTSKLQAAEEDNFNLLCNMSSFEAETRYASDKKEREMQSRIAALESKLSFMHESLQNADRAKLRAIHEVEQLQQKQLVESKRRDAERRLMATKRRKHENFLAASQSMMLSEQQSQQSQSTARPPPNPIPAVETAVQTESEHEATSSSDLKEENARLVSYLLTGTSRDLLTLLNGAVAVSTGEEVQAKQESDRTQSPQQCQSSTPTQFFQGSSDYSMNDSMQQSSSGVQFSQSVFSQLAGRASAQAHASLLSVAIETNAAQTSMATDRAQELFDVLGRMLAGDVSAVALAPVLTKYLAAPTDLEATVICSVLRVMYSVMHHSAHFQHFLLVSSESSSAATGLQRNPNSTEHPRISLPGLRFTSLDDYLSARSDYESVVQSDLLQLSAVEVASEQRQLHTKLMSALCRVIKNNLKEPVVVKDGLCVLSFWVDLGLSHRPALTPDFKPLLTNNVIPAILLAPKGLPVIKAQALGLLSQLLRVPEVFPEVETESKKSLLFNRCSKMLAHEGSLSSDEANNLRTLQHQIVKLLLSIITLFPSDGIRFVLESTHGLPSDSDGHRSVIYYLAHLLHQETFDARRTNAGGESCVTQELFSDEIRVGLIQDAFALLGLLSRYVDLRRELGGDDHIQTFLAVLYFLNNLTQHSTRHDSIAASARSLVSMMNSPQ